MMDTHFSYSPASLGHVTVAEIVKHLVVDKKNHSWISETSFENIYLSI